MEPFVEMTGLPPADNALARKTHEKECRDSAFIDQKNTILGMVYDATEPEELERASALLAFAAPLWEAVGYTYTQSVVRNLIVDRAERLLHADETYLSGLRKNDKTLRQTKSDIAKYVALINSHKV